MGSTAAGKPPPYEQTHNFTDYPSSHVDIDEVKNFNISMLKFFVT
jgi:hypothetical protein